MTRQFINCNPAANPIKECCRLFLFYTSFLADNGELCHFRIDFNGNYQMVIYPRTDDCFFFLFLPVGTAQRGLFILVAYHPTRLSYRHSHPSRLSFAKRALSFYYIYELAGDGQRVRDTVVHVPFYFWHKTIFIICFVLRVETITW